ncbi:serine/threonine protein kinase [Fischerella sp. PCC 9605]|uniref:serine/threonine protein kinase n=1 Tax=Fischerella sp. PCC 9605 TaxID=1173024 RepID=UPI0004B89C72|nr:serine/threonine-protein kinase [Fischerella sp. PCC 9605]
MQNNDTYHIILINRYRIERELSHKAGRKTFLAQDTYSQDLVIIKILQFDSFFQWDNLKLFEREANTLKNLDHPAIPKYLNYFEVDEENIQGFALVQTYIDAPSLESTMQEGRKFSGVELIELAEKLLEILAYLHEQIPPVIHRDIKPSNILISNRSGHSIGDVYLVDFGSVQTVASKDNGTITIVGSYGYIPLEQFSGQTTTASDLYSLGMTLIYLITGVHPAELTQVNGRVKFSNNDLSNQFSRWLEKITYPYPDQRFESAKLAKTALTSKDGTSGDYLHLRPANSQVKLYRDRHKLEIVYEENYPLNIPGCLGCSSIFLLIIFSPVFLPLFMNYWILLLFFTGFLLSVFYLLRKASYQMKDKYYRVISIERDREIKVGSYYGKPSNIEWSERYSFFKNINLLVYNPGYTFDKYFDETGKEIRRGEVKVNPNLSIHAGHIEYPIGNQKLSPAELWWLGKELSDFFGLELQVIYPTPKVLPEQTCGGC